MKKGLIISGVVLAVILFFTALIFSTNNTAISLEEQIAGANAQIEVQEKRRVDLVYNLVDVVKESAEYEKATLTGVIDQRTSNGVDGAKMLVNAVAEAYPTLKANENYVQLMNELSITENFIAEYRNNYNVQVRSYKKFVRSFPAKFILGVLGYEVTDVQYTEYNAPETAPQNLFVGK